MIVTIVKYLYYYISRAALINSKDIAQLESRISTEFWSNQKWSRFHLQVHFLYEAYLYTTFLF